MRFFALCLACVLLATSTSFANHRTASAGGCSGSQGVGGCSGGVGSGPVGRILNGGILARIRNRHKSASAPSVSVQTTVIRQAAPLPEGPKDATAK